MIGDRNDIWSMKKPLAIIIVFMVGCFRVAAQEAKWENEGELEDVEIEIVRERQINLPRASRNFEKIPPRPSEPIKPEITYDFRNLSFNTRDFNPTIRPLRLRQEEIAKIYGNYVSIGYGNFGSPYLDGWFNSKRDKTKFFGAHVLHESFGRGPVDDNNSASSNSEVRIFGKAFGKNLSTGGYINYENKGGYFYGYDPALEVNRDTIKQRYQIVSLAGQFSNTQPGDFNFNLAGSFSYLQDDYEAAESEVGLGFSSQYKLADNGRLYLGGNYNLITRKDELVDAKPRNLLTINPAFEFDPIEGLKLRIGAKAAFENDSISSKDVHFYPDVEARYELSPSITTYASLSGGMDKVSLHTLSAENLWLDANVPIFHTNRGAEFTTGLKGRVGRRVALQVGFAAANLKDWYFFQNDSSDPSKFTVVYDRGNTQRVNFFGELGYSQGDKIRLSLRGDYFGYSTDQLSDAWHRPQYTARFKADFNIYEKVAIGFYGLALGGMRALEPSSATAVELDAAIDLGLKLDYFVSKHLSVFVRCNNVLSREYPLFLNYPVRGFQAKGGLTWAF